MSQSESPARMDPRHRVTVEDVRQLMGASTPHFALQLRDRIARVDRRPRARRPGAVLGEREIARLEALAFDGELRGAGAQDGQHGLPSLAD